MAGQVNLPHMGGVTISAELTAKMIEALRKGEFKNSERLPSELELAEHFKVSRSVIRDMLSNLEQAGFVERGRGIGTVIHRDIVQLKNRLDIKSEYYELISEAGYKPSADSVKLYEEVAEEEMAHRLSIDIGDPLICCEKRVLAGDTPVIYSIDRLPRNIFSGLDYTRLDWRRPVFDLLEENCGIVVDTDLASLSAVMGPAFIRDKLALGEEDALVMIDEVGYYKLSYPILHSYGYYTDFFHFTILRKKF